MSEVVAKITGKLKKNERINEADALYLFESDDLIEVGYLASQINYNKNRRHVTASEHRIIRTSFGDFTGDFFRNMKNDEECERYLEILCERTEKLLVSPNTKLNLGSTHPSMIHFNLLLKIISRLRKAFPGQQLIALGAHEIIKYAQEENTSLDTILQSLHQAGLMHLNGKGGSPFFPFSQPITPLATEKWFAVHASAHHIGIKSEATMNYGHGETYFDRLQFLKRLRDLQDKHSSFTGFTALARHIHGERLSDTLGVDDLKTVAVSRIYLDNFSTISSSWGRLGLDIAQLSLSFGANGLCGVLSNDSNKRVVGARPFRSIGYRKISSIVRKAESIPFSGSEENLKQSILCATPLERDEDCTTRLLYKAEKNDELSQDEMLTISSDASLLELGYLSSQIKANLLGAGKVGVLTHAYEVSLIDLCNPKEAVHSCLDHLKNCRKSLHGAPYGIHVNLGKWPDEAKEFTLSSLEFFFKELKNSEQSELQFIVKGIKGLWRLGRGEMRPLIRVLNILKTSHVEVIESSGSEAEDDLTHIEVINTHRTIHELDICSVAKAEIAAPFNGFDPPFFDSLLKRLSALKILQEETHGIIGIKVEPAPRSAISPYEYLKAVAICRIFVRNIPNIIAPFLKIPSLEETKGKPSLTSFKSCIKFVPVCIQFGANDIGFVKHGNNDVLKIFQELHSSSINYYQRTSRFQQY